MRFLTSQYIYSLAEPPIANAVLVADDQGVIDDIIPYDTVDPLLVEHYDGILCPGFINAHCHLELSWMKGLVRPQLGLVQFILELHTLRTQQEPHDEAHYSEQLHQADQHMFESGIVGVGDISNRAVTFGLKQQSAIRYHTFVEVFGLGDHRADTLLQQGLQVLQQAHALGLSASLTPHAPYSTSNRLLSHVLDQQSAGHHALSMHFLESPDEKNWYEQGNGGMLDLYDYFHVPIAHRPADVASWWQTVRSAVQRHAVLLLVHNTVATEQNLRELQQVAIPFYLCTCPKANLFIENQLPDYRVWRKVTDCICVGTDSLAANDQLCMLEELKTIQLHNPDLPTEELLRWACRNGAACFGWSDLGTLERGKKPGINLITNVSFPEGRLTTASRIQRLV